MKTMPTKMALTPPCRRLVELMQRVNHGKIKGLHFSEGEPLFHPRPRLIRKIKIAGANGPRPEAVSNDFTLRKEVTEFLEHLKRQGTGVVKCIDVQHGLPFSMEIEEEDRG